MLVKVFGPHRAITIQMFFESWGIIFWGVIPMSIGLFFYIHFASLKHEHVGFVKGEVLFVTSDSAEASGFTTRFVIRTSDGQYHMLSTNNMVLSASVVETACLEIRRYVDSKKLTYLLAQQEKCAE